MSQRNPFDELERIFDRMSQQFEQFDAFEKPTLGGVSVDVKDTDGAFVVTADMPGFEREDIDVELDDTQLRIAAEQSSETEAEEEGSYIHRERTRTAVSRTVQLPEHVVESETEATYQNGVLTVRLPKRESGSDTGTNIPVN